MDPSIIKMLEEDEDESMHSGADVEAFSAALGRDMKGETSTSQTHASETGSNPSSTQMFSQWQPSRENESFNSEGRQDIKSLQQKGQHSSEIELKHHDSGTENQLHVTDNTSQELSSLPLQQSQMQQQQQPAEQNPVQFSQTTGMQISDQNLIQAREPPNSSSDSQMSKLQNVTSQPLLSKEQANNPVNRSKQVPFAMLLPVIVPQLDKDRAMQLQTLYAKLKRNEIPKEGFVRHMRSIVGDHMLKMAVVKLQQGTTKSQVSVNSQTGGNQFQLQSQASAQQHRQKMASQFSDAHSFGQLHQRGHSSPADTSTVATSAAQLRVDSTYPNTENTAQKSQEMERQSDPRGMPVSQMSSSSVSAIKQEPQSTMPVHVLNKQQQHIHFSQTSFPMYGSAGSSYNPYSGATVNTPATSLRPLNHDSQVRQVPPPQGICSAQIGAAPQAMNVMNMPKFERQSPITDPERVRGGPIPNMLNNSSVQQNSASWQSHLAKGQNSGTLSSINYVKQEPLDQSNEQQMKSQLPAGQASFSSANIEQGNAISGGLKDDALEKNTSRMGFSTPMGLMSANSVSTSATTALDVQLGSHLPSTTSPVTAGTTIRTPPKKPSIGQKKPLDPPGSSPPGSSKKQKVSGAFLDQSIDQLNDVTAVSGVNLREEEEQLFSGPKEDSRVSEASRRVVQEEEERLILQKGSLQKKLAEIMARCGLKNISNDVERCLSLCVEERMRGLISNLIRLSKQRLDVEKQRHRAIITSDVCHQILTMNRKAREELDKKQAEQEKLRKENEPESSAGADGDKEKEDGHAKPTKSNKEEDDKMRTTAANVAARAAVGGDDMLSKWQLMAEQARQKREGGTDAASGSQPGKNGTRKPLSTAGRNAKDSFEAEKRAHAAVGISVARKLVRHPAIPQTSTPHSISIKDVIAALEREPQMSKSTLIYRLYEKISANAASE
ncbi:Transcription initiation factor TFIID component TAF4, C-terminal [Dillenia turbinata]|uniref:Transcription initiation factor TFIID component TAF4, C-terminal n=1 Tax=Dillenia turbinata TaxID=194707 RepID=A0AAN8ZI49_9MAGN